eukprot:345102-Pyramimonas_sp.AAC.1
MAKTAMKVTRGFAHVRKALKRPAAALVPQERRRCRKLGWKGPRPHKRGGQHGYAHPHAARPAPLTGKAKAGTVGGLRP